MNKPLAPITSVKPERPWTNKDNYSDKCHWDVKEDEPWKVYLTSCESQFVNISESENKYCRSCGKPTAFIKPTESEG